MLAPSTLHIRLPLPDDRHFLLPFLCQVLDFTMLNLRTHKGNTATIASSLTFTETFIIFAPPGIPTGLLGAEGCYR